MGYDIRIGETYMHEVEDEYIRDGYTTEYTCIVHGQLRYYEPKVKDITLPDAPSFPNDGLWTRTNLMVVSYAGWESFCKKAGLHDLFFNAQEGLMHKCPADISYLHMDHALVIEQTFHRWKESHPNAIPGFEKRNYEDLSISNIGYDYTLARLIWLDWWVKWALKNCEQPALYYS